VCAGLTNLTLAQDTPAAAVEQDGPEPPGHVKKRLTKKLHFLERVADSKHQALAATAGIRKKRHKSKGKQKKALPDLNSLAELLAEVDQKQSQQAPKESQGGTDQPNKQKGRTEQINGTKARRAVTYVPLLLYISSLTLLLLPNDRSMSNILQPAQLRLEVAGNENLVDMFARSLAKKA